MFKFLNLYINKGNNTIECHKNFSKLEILLNLD